MHRIFLWKFKDFADKNSNYIPHKEKRENRLTIHRLMWCGYFYSFPYLSIKIFIKGMTNVIDLTNEEELFC